MKLNADSLATHLRDRLLPVYLISGDEPLLAAEAADAIRARARSGGFTAREVHFIERAADWSDVRAAAANLGLFAERRLIEIRLSGARPGAAGSAALIALTGSAASDTLFLIRSPRLDRESQNSEWVRALETRGAWVQIWPVDAARLPAWLKRRAGQRGLTPGDEALRLLAARTEGNLLAADQELTKLALLGEQELTPAAVLAGVADSARFDVFQLTDAVLAGDTARALRVLAGLRAEGTEAVLVLWALGKALRDTWNALRGDGARAGGWQRGTALEAARRRAPRLSFAALALRATRADRMIKGRLTGNAWDEMALWCADFCSVPVMPPPVPARLQA